MILLLYTTFGSEDAAREVTHQLIEERLIACANLIESTSLYRWEGELQEEDEVVALCKTTAEKRDAVRERLAELHPYEVPCIVFYEAEGAAAPYADWIESSL
ncbi:MAG: divalent-cation tolerance protein CutA [Candidatus Nanohaloarchaea archaeon]|nr:divalent-cation tolerance protein CutA [Candidatus Nanohaloarchaea archaeon]